MASIPRGIPVELGLPAQLGMGNQSPLELSGFKAADMPQWSGENWEIVGEDSQTLMVLVHPGASVMTEPGGMLLYAQGVEPSCDTGGLGLAVKRGCCSGESCFRVHWKNTSTSPVSVGLGPSFPAKVVPMDLDQEGGEIYIKKAAWLASINSDNQFDMTCTTFANACCGGQGCCLTTVKGTGMAFLNVGGTVIQKRLAVGESIIVDTDSLVAWSKTVKFDVKRAGSCMTVCMTVCVCVCLCVAVYVYAYCEWVYMYIHTRTHQYTNTRACGAISTQN